jgi:hypothetical protein
VIIACDSRTQIISIKGSNISFFAQFKSF